MKICLLTHRFSIWVPLCDSYHSVIFSHTLLSPVYRGSIFMLLKIILDHSGPFLTLNIYPGSHFNVANVLSVDL